MQGQKKRYPVISDIRKVLDSASIEITHTKKQKTKKKLKFSPSARK